MNRSDFLKLVRLRLADARILLKNSKHEGAYYLCGYAVECALKACIAKQTKRYQFPDKETVNKSYTHNPTKLVQIAGLKPALDAEIKRDRDFEANWSVVRDWSEESRYEWHSAKEARDLYSAITGRKHGIMQWLRKHW
ncbi:MAG: HEPN domain-containing protein [Pirellulales bacterium]|nr:HEPN domain-containing protein [Pirellulales bacterium]